MHFFLWILLASALAAPAGDWPMYRHDAARSAVSPHDLPADLRLQWVRRLPPPRPAWPATQDRLQFDAAYEPVVLGHTIFVPSMVADSVTACDTATGEERWRFYAGGPVRLAPAAWRDRLFVASDDGVLYALDAATGRLLWQVRGGPADRAVLGNDRLISAWPARGGPVVADGVVYFAAGIWPFMGIFICAVDAESGALLWRNSGESATFITQPHNSPAFGGVAPQGHLAATAERLLVPGGRSVPAVLDRQTGSLLYFRLGAAMKEGGCDVTAAGRWFLNDGVLYSLDDGRALLKAPSGIATPDAIYFAASNRLQAVALPPEESETINKEGQPVREYAWRRTLDAAMNPAPVELFIKAGSCLYGSAGRGVLMAIALKGGAPPSVAWQATVDGTPRSLLAADDRLFVATAEGALYAFGAAAGDGATREYPRPAAGRAPLSTEPRASQVKALLDDDGVRDGYALVLGLGDGRLAEEVLTQSALHVVILDSNAAAVDAFRRRMDEAGLYGTQAAALVGDASSIRLPPYFASLIVAEALDSAHLPDRSLLDALRPYGGAACLLTSGESADAVLKWARASAPGGAEVDAVGGWVRVRRPGPLPGAAAWTHQYADAANTVVSRDQLVKPPLGLLWFGGPPNDPILPRHGHGPSPQVVGGRLFIEGADLLRAVDVYTGRLLWERELKGLGKFYDVTTHQPGANEVGANFVSVEDGVYVAYGRKALWLDPATGQTRREFRLPAAGGGPPPHWGYVGVWSNWLIAGAAPFTAVAPDTNTVEVRLDAPQAEASKRLVVMDRRSGDVLWQREAACAFRHNTIAAGGGRLFCLDSVTPAKRALLARRGLEPRTPPALYALDIRTGGVLWQAGAASPGDVSGTWLGYSEEHDVLLGAGSRARDRARDEAGKGMIAFRGRDGVVLWREPDRSHGGPCLLRRDGIITQDGAAYDLLTGRPRLRSDPLTGRQVPWSFSRQYGCNTVLGGEHMLTFRSAAAGYFNLDQDGGTGNFGGFKSGCSPNLIAADGVLSAPDYTRTCQCSYPNQSSVALVHDPTAEEWTFSNTNAWSGAPIRRLGLNFGAPGNRVADDGTLWLEFPSTGGPSPEVPVELVGGQPAWFRQHSSLLGGAGWPWVMASGVEGITGVTVRLARKAAAERLYTVRLHFAEPERSGPAGARVFDVALQGEAVLRDFDIRREAGGELRGVIREFGGVRVRDDLKVGLIPRQGQPLICGLEAVEEGSQEL